MAASLGTCTAAEPKLMRVLRVSGIALLTLISAVLAGVTRPVIDVVNAATFLRLGMFVATLGMLASSVAAFWWRDASLRRAEWAAYLGLALLIALQFAPGANGGPAHSIALIFGLYVAAIVLARVSRRTNASACNCG